MRQIDADKIEREITLAYIETCRGLTLEQIDAVARFSAKVISIIGHTPTAEAEPKHGKNIADGRFGNRENKHARIFLCSVCGYGFDDIYLCNESDYPIEPNYCPNCGARVDDQEAAEIINDGTYSAGDLYECDPEKNTECNKRGCFINGGECRLTSNEAFKREGGENHDG